MILLLILVRTDAKSDHLNLFYNVLKFDYV